MHCEKGNISCERKVCTPKSRNDEWIAKEKEKRKRKKKKKRKKKRKVEKEENEYEKKNEWMNDAIRLGVQRINLR